MTHCRRLVFILLALIVYVTRHHGVDAAVTGKTVNGTACKVSKVATMRSTFPICVEAEEKYAASNNAAGEDFTLKNGPGATEFEAIIQGFLRGEMDVNKAAAYGISVGMLAIVPFLCCFGNGFCGSTHCLARTCCELICPSHCLMFMCRPNPKKPYSKLAKLMPLASLLLFGGALSIAAISGIAGGTSRFENTYIRGACFVDTTRIRVTSFIDEFRTPVVGFKSSFKTISDDVASRIGSVAGVNAAMDHLATKYGALKTAAGYQSGENPLSRGNADCVALEGIADAADRAEAESINAAKDFADTMNRTSSSVNDTLIGFKDTISEAIDGADALAMNLRAQVDDSLNSSSASVMQLARYMKRNPDLTSGTAFGLFGWTFLLLGLFMLGFVLILLNSHEHEIQLGQVRSNRKLEGKILDVGHVGSCGARFGALSWCLVFLFGAIASGTAMAFLPFSAVFTDICVVAEDLPMNLGSYMPQIVTPLSPSSSPTSGSTGGSPATSSSSGQDGDVEVPVLNVNQIMTTCWNGGSIYDALNMKETIPINTSEMFSGMDEIPESGALPQEEFLELKKVADEQLENCPSGKSRMQTRIADIEVANSALEKEIADYSAVLGGIEENSVKILESSIDKIKCVKCDFIKATWNDVFRILCKDARLGFSTVAVAATVVGFMSFFTGLAMLLVLRRWAGHGPIKAHDHGDDGLQLAITTKLESCCGCVSHHRKPVEGKYDAPIVELVATEENTTVAYTMNSDNIAESNQNQSSAYVVQEDPQVNMPEEEGQLI